MSEEIKIDVKMTATRFKAHFNFIERGRASGIDYMLLKMIGYAEKSTQNLSISDIMSIFSISGDLLPFILSEIDGLRTKDMIRFEGKSLNKDTKVRNLKFTDNGRKIFEQGYINIATGEFEDYCLYFPARMNHFEKDKEVIAIGKMAQKRIDDSEFKTHVISNKGQFGMGEQAEISGRPKLETVETFSYFQPVHIYFNNDKGKFEVSGNSGLDMVYVGSHVPGNALVEKVPESCFKMDGAEFTVNRWDSVPDEGAEYLLPSDFEMPKGPLLYKEERISRPAVNIRVKIDESIAGDLVSITNGRDGYRYWFCTMKSPLIGFEDVTKTINVVARKRITPGEIRKCVRTAFDGLNLQSLDDIKMMNNIVRTLREPKLFSDRVMKEVELSDTTAIHKILENLNKLESKIWREDLRNALGDMIDKRIKDGMDEETLSTLRAVLNRDGY